MSWVSILLSAGLMFASVAGAAGDCDAVSGPSGAIQCSTFLWESCVTSEYIEALTGGASGCDDATSTFCWFGCVAESLNSGSSIISTALCACNPTATIPAGSLPADCYSPSGKDCDWYANCLEAQFPCSGTSAGYAIEYGTKFCTLYIQNINLFSPLGQQWVAAVRTCLQVKLVPLLRPNRTPTPNCSEIHDTAFASHAPCYLQPDTVGSPSVCDLSFSDFFGIMFTIAEWNAVTITESICAGVDVFRDCKAQWTATRPCIRTVVVAVNLMSKSRIERSVDSAARAAKVAEQIGEKLKWNDLLVRFLGCFADLMVETGTLYMNIILASTDVINCFKQLVSPAGGAFKRSVTSVDLDEVVRALEDAVRSGSLLLDVDGGSVYVSAVGECDLMTCQGVTATDVTAPELPVTTTAAAAETDPDADPADGSDPSDTSDTSSDTSEPAKPPVAPRPAPRPGHTPVRRRRRKNKDKNGDKAKSNNKNEDKGKPVNKKQTGGQKDVKTRNKSKGE